MNRAGLERLHGIIIGDARFVHPGLRQEGGFIGEHDRLSGAPLPATTAMLMRTRIEACTQDPASQASNVKSLKGREGIRLRVGDWRVIIDDQGLAFISAIHRH